MISDDKRVAMFAAGTSYVVLMCLATLCHVPHSMPVTAAIGAIGGLASYAARQEFLRRHPGRSA